MIVTTIRMIASVMTLRTQIKGWKLGLVRNLQKGHSLWKVDNKLKQVRLTTLLTMGSGQQQAMHQFWGLLIGQQWH
jgi:hypothetical protein